MKAAIVLAIIIASAQAAEQGYWRGQPVTYEVVNALAVAEGDIVLGTAAELQGSPKRASREAAVVSSEQYRWPDGVIPYVIEEGLTDSKRVTDAIEHWNAKTYIRMTPRGDEANYVVFAKASDGCNSQLGMVGGAQKINLGSGCSTKSIIHEIGHAVGLFHEQSRIDRDKWVRYSPENIDKRAAFNFIQRLNDGADVGSYDFASIMHYDFGAGARNNGTVLESIPAGIAFGLLSQGLSAADIDSVRRMYKQPIESTTIDSFPSGLPLRVDGSVIFTPQTFHWPAGSTHSLSVVTLSPTATVRLLFGRWSDDGDVSHTITSSPNTSVYTASFIFQLKQSTSVTPAESGSVSIEPQAPDGFYHVGQRLEIIASPNPDFQFSGWSGNTGAGILHGRGQANVKVPVLDAFNYTANFTTNPLTTITSEPAGLQIVVDGETVMTPHIAAWQAGTEHSVNVANTSQFTGSNTARHIFRGWSDEGLAEHTIQAREGSSSIVARFQTQHHVTFIAFPEAAGRLEVTPNSQDGFYDAGTTLRIEPVTRGTGRFNRWVEDLSGSAIPEFLMVDEQKFVVGLFQP